MMTDPNTTRVSLFGTPALRRPHGGAGSWPPRHYRFYGMMTVGEHAGNVYCYERSGETGDWAVSHIDGLTIWYVSADEIEDMIESGMLDITARHPLSPAS